MTTEPTTPASPEFPVVEHEPLPAQTTYSFLCTCGAHSVGTIDDPAIYQHHLDAIAHAEAAAWEQQP